MGPHNNQSIGLEVSLHPTATAAVDPVKPVKPVKPDKLFRQLVNDHQKRLYRFVLKRIGNGSDAEDLTQQAFVEAAAAVESFRGDSECSTWLYGIAMNLVKNYLSRSPHRRYTFVTEDWLEGMAALQPDPCEQLMHSQSIIALQREIDDLPQEMREVLLLVALDEMSYEEAALLLTIPVGTVRSRLSRARQTLRVRTA
jgi:RNA polymerase sigma factor (sigma-70 family)